MSLDFVRYLIQLKPAAAKRQVSNYWKLRRPTTPLKLHIGCGKKRFDGFVNIDMNTAATVDYTCDALRLPCPPNSVDRIEWYHVIEHVPLPDVEPTLQLFFKILRPGGVLVTECPNLDEAIRQYLAGNRERLFSVYGRQRFPGDAHHWGYTPESLSAIFERLGFVNILSMQAQDDHAANEPCMRIESSKP